MSELCHSHPRKRAEQRCAELSPFLRGSGITLRRVVSSFPEGERDNSAQSTLLPSHPVRIHPLPIPSLLTTPVHRHSSLQGPYVTAAGLGAPLSREEALGSNLLKEPVWRVFPDSSQQFCQERAELRGPETRVNGQQRRIDRIPPGQHAP